MAAKHDSEGLARQERLLLHDSDQHGARGAHGMGVQGSGKKTYGEQGGMQNGARSAKPGINRALKSHPQH